MKEVSEKSVRERIIALEEADKLFGLGLSGEFELACLRKLLSTMTTKSPNPADGDVQALIERLNRLALKWHNVGYAQDILKAVDLLTTPPAQLLRPVELPQSFYGVVQDGKSVMLPADDGQWLNKTAVIETLRQQGYEVKS